MANSTDNIDNNDEETCNLSNKSAMELFNSIINEKENENENKKEKENEKKNEKKNENTDNSIEYCLISKEPLDNSKITLPCGHSFKYLPLLDDLINYMKWHYTITNRCPYCLQAIKGNLIPYREDISKKFHKSINPKMNNSSCFFRRKCCHDDCEINAPIPHLNDTFICHKHYRSYIVKQKNALKRINKQNEKKLRKSSEKSSNVIENEVVQADLPKCSAILKSGKRKGECCNAVIKQNGNTYCKRHNK